MPRKPVAPASRAATTPCPRCGAGVPVRGERGTCPACGLAVRFVDAPERPCAACGKPMALPPGQDAARCGSCGVWQAADPSRVIEGRTTCPRCGREVAVPLVQDRVPCPRCGAGLRLGAIRFQP